jgi:quercetin dioxygenase-like cupin family protein
MSSPSWQFGTLEDKGLAHLRGASSGMHDVEGRFMEVLASPAIGNATRLAVGFSALPPGFAVPEHSHEAEEVAIVLRGSGVVTIDGEDHPISAGTALLHPARSVHATVADRGSELLVLWIYAPAGSEERWLESARQEARRDG